MGQILKTNIHLCRKCKYSYGGKGGTLICCYYLRTFKRRGCKVGECDKFEEGENKESPWEEQLIE